MSSALARRGARAQYPSLATRLGVDSGCHRLLETPLVINGAEGSTVLRFLGSQASAAGWPEYGGAGTLALQAGTAPTYGVPSPYGPGSTPDTGCQFNAGGYFQAATAALGDITTEDIVVEAVIRFAGLWPKRAVSKTKYLLFTGIAPDLTFYIPPAPGIELPAMTAGQVVHCLWGVNRDEASVNGAVGYKNAVAGAGQDYSSVAGSLTTTAKLTLGASPNGTDLGSDGVLLFALHLREAWHQAGAAGPAEWLAIAKQRFALLTGSRPLISIASATSLAAGGNAGPAYQDRIVSGAQRLFYMGAGAPRFVQRTDGAGRTFVGASIEAGAQNVALQSQVAGTSRTGVNASIAASNSDTAPDGTLTADTLTASADGGYLKQAYAAITAVSRVESYYVRRNGAGNVAGKLQIVKTSDASVIAEVAFTATAVYQRVQIAGTCVLNDTESRLVVNTNGESLFIWQEDFTPDDYASSPIVTTTAAVTRAADAPHRISGAAHFGPTGFSYFSDLLCPVFTPGRKHYLESFYKASDPTNYFVSLYVDTDGLLKLESKAGAGAAGAVASVAAVNTNLVARYVISAQQNLLRLWLAGVEATPDTTFDLPAGLDTHDRGADVSAALQAGPVLPGAQFQLCAQPAMGSIPEPSGFVFQG